MKDKETAVFGGGCFWCTEAIFQNLKGVISVTPGYAGGSKEHPTYEDVSYGNSGHAEVIQVEFDPSVISYNVLLDVFFHTHDPTSLNRQGADMGSQYRSVVFYVNEEQKKIVERRIEEMDASGEFKEKIVTEIQPLSTFYDAESYHRDYYNKNESQPYCQFVISPKLQHLREKYKKLLK